LHAEKALLDELKDALAKGTAQDVVYWMKVHSQGRWQVSQSVSSGSHA
jgi:hypothetical protein